MSKRILSGMQCIPLLLVIVFCVSCNEIEKIELNKTSIDQIDEEYLSQLPINFELGKEHIDEAVSNLSLIYREEYGKKQIEYIRPINSKEETILWLVQFKVNGGWMLFSNHINASPVIAHNNKGYFTNGEIISFDDLLSNPRPAQLLTIVKKDFENLKNGQINDFRRAKSSHAKWSVLIEDVPKLKDREYVDNIIQSSDPIARTAAYEHLNMAWVHQLPPFNQHMPVNGTENCFVGGNNVVLGQIFKSYGIPVNMGWDYQAMPEKSGVTESYTVEEASEWARMFADIALTNQPERICAAEEHWSRKLWSWGFLSKDYEYLTSIPEYENAKYDSASSEIPGDWDIEKVYLHAGVLKEPVIIESWYYDEYNQCNCWSKHTWIIDGCERTKVGNDFNYEVHCLWGWNWLPNKYCSSYINYNGWWNYDYMLGWDQRIGLITDLKPKKSKLKK
jgi:hypothetical protein